MAAEASISLDSDNERQRQVLAEEVESGVAHRFGDSVKCTRSAGSTSLNLSAPSAHDAHVAQTYASKVVSERSKRPNPAVAHLRERADSVRQSTGLVRIELRVPDDVMQHICGKRNANLHAAAEARSRMYNPAPFVNIHGWSDLCSACASADALRQNCGG